ncbi:MAG: hypothetical protein Q8L68_06410 [Methylococcales bacterium]|nr:hypothetical protein [Methylococcales bacterium]
MFLVYFPFAGGCFSSGNDADDVPAKRVNDHYNSQQNVPANGDEATFGFMLIFDGDGIFILENRHGICEPDAMLFQV